MDEQMILFANLFRHLKAIREELKLVDKGVQSLLQPNTWENLTLTLNGIVSETQLMQVISETMQANVDMFLKRGPYLAQGAGKLPLEGMAEE